MYFTVPETYEPTGTVVKGLMVPVACTTDVMAPCSTRAVRNLGGSGLRLSVQAAAMATPVAAAAASHPTFNRLLLPCSSCTIGPERPSSHPITVEPVDFMNLLLRSMTLLGEPRQAHSARRAATGSIRVARRAGQ